MEQHDILLYWTLGDVSRTSQQFEQRLFRGPES